MFKKIVLTSMMLASSSLVLADNYVLDTKGAHAAIQFKVSHLGYSWLVGRFNTFSGTIDYDKANPEAMKVVVDIQTDSIDSNHAERDKHLRGDDFLAVKEFPTAKFVSNGYIAKDENNGMLTGDLTLHGVTKPVNIKVTKLGEGKDPWGGYRIGFSGQAEFAMKDFGIKKDLGPKSQMVYLTLEVEAIKK